MGDENSATYKDVIQLSLSQSNTRTLPNILLTGTPGTGKTRLASAIAVSTPGFKHLNIAEMVKLNSWYESFDEAYDSLILDEKKLIKGIKRELATGGCIIDFHGSDLFPKKFIDLVVVLTVPKTEILYDRLNSRGYSALKIEENIDGEIMQIVLEEASNYFPQEKVISIDNSSEHDFHNNLNFLKSVLS